MSVEQKKAYTGRCAATASLSTLDTTKRPLKIIWNLCQYVINRTWLQFTVGDLSCRGTASGVDSITDYNEFYSILSRPV